MNSNQNIKINTIVAIASKNRAIGTRDGKIPWHISDDLKHFKETTTGFPIIMGRKTFESFGGRILPNRHHIIITRQKNYQLPECLRNEKTISIVQNIESAIKLASEKVVDSDKKEIFIIGGGEIYRMALPFTDRLYITLIEKNDGSEIYGDVFFPEYKEIFTRVISSKKGNDENYSFEFQVLDKE